MLILLAIILSSNLVIFKCVIKIINKFFKIKSIFINIIVINIKLIIICQNILLKFNI